MARTNKKAAGGKKKGKKKPKKTDDEKLKSTLRTMGMENSDTYVSTQQSIAGIAKVRVPVDCIHKGADIRQVNPTDVEEFMKKFKGHGFSHLGFQILVWEEEETTIDINRTDVDTDHKTVRVLAKEVIIVPHTHTHTHTHTYTHTHTHAFTQLEEKYTEIGLPIPQPLPLPYENDVVVELFKGRKFYTIDGMHRVTALRRLMQQTEDRIQELRVQASEGSSSSSALQALEALLLQYSTVTCHVLKRELINVTLLAGCMNVTSHYNVAIDFFARVRFMQRYRIEASEEIMKDQRAEHAQKVAEAQMSGQRPPPFIKKKIKITQITKRLLKHVGGVGPDGEFIGLVRITHVVLLCDNR